MAFLADGGMVWCWVDGTGVVRLLGRKPSFLWELSWTWAEGIVCYFETGMTSRVKIDISACQDKAVCFGSQGSKLSREISRLYQFSQIDIATI